MRVELILEVIGRNLGLLDKVQDATEKVAKTAKTVPGGSASPEPEPKAKNPKSAEQSYAGAKSGLFDAAATAAAVGAPIYKAVSAWNTYEDVLADVGLKADASADKLSALDKTFRAQEKAVNTSRLDLAKGFDQLMAGGLDFDKSAELAAPLAKVTRATKAQIEDVSKSTVALVNNLKVVPAEVQRAFDVMNQTGKEGQFELKDQAQYFPKIGARYAAMGQTGVRAVADLSAALQVMRMNVGTSGEAVTNLEDLLLKFTKSPAIKGFEEAGMNGDAIKKRMAEAQKTGKILETMQAIMQEATKGDLSKLNDIFSDKQALGGATALMQHWQKLIEIRKNALEQGQGSIDRDFATRMGLGVEKVQALSVAMEGLWTTMGRAFAPMVAEKIDQLLNLINTIESWVRLNPELAASIAKVATTVAALMVGVAALKLVFAALRLGGVVTAFRLIGVAARLAFMPIALLGRFLLGFGQGAAAAVAAMGGWRVVLVALGSRILGLVVGPLAMLRNAFIAIGAAMLANPIGLVVAGLAAVAAAAYLIYNNWDRIGPMLAALWESIKAKAIAAWDGIVEWFGGLGGRIGDAISSGWDKVAGLFENFKPLDAIIKALEPVLKWVEDWGGKIFSAFSGAFDKIGKFLDGVSQKVGAIISGVGDIASKVGSWFSSDPKIIDPVKMQAGIDKAKEYETQIKAIGPAAQQAVSQANTVLAAANFHSHGVRMMETLATGIRAGSNAAVNAVRETVQKIRDHLPHSPAKVGPLSDLDRVQFAQTLAGAIERGSPKALAAARTLAAGLAATVPMSQPAFASMPAGAHQTRGSQGGVSGGGDVTVNLTLSPNFKGGSSEDFVAQLKAALPDIGYELGQAIRVETARRDRTKF